MANGGRSNARFGYLHIPAQGLNSLVDMPSVWNPQLAHSSEPLSAARHRPHAGFRGSGLPSDFVGSKAKRLTCTGTITSH